MSGERKRKGLFDEFFGGPLFRDVEKMYEQMEGGEVPGTGYPIEYPDESLRRARVKFIAEPTKHRG